MFHHLDASTTPGDDTDHGWVLGDLDLGGAGDPVCVVIRLETPEDDTAAPLAAHHLADLLNKRSH